MAELFLPAALRQPTRRRRRTFAFAFCRITTADSATTTIFLLLPHHSGRLDDGDRKRKGADADENPALTGS